MAIAMKPSWEAFLHVGGRRRHLIEELDTRRGERARDAHVKLGKRGVEEKAGRLGERGGASGKRGKGERGMGAMRVWLSRCGCEHSLCACGAEHGRAEGVHKSQACGVKEVLILETRKERNTAAHT
ncbi:hypothetical protein M5K25_003221 [Dendrobium thyrsiflorum]|uniref:Uncharacterized protein n=1 Tax=Dendrobium thyrsiflorum TaxID=117978 RepID=A0ABD0VXJ4_DENTH